MAGATAREAEGRGVQRGKVRWRMGSGRVRVWVREETKVGHGGRTVIGVALLVGRELQQQLLRRRSREVLATERQPRRQPGDEGRGARAWMGRGLERGLE